jgi:hypothetical protein
MILLFQFSNNSENGVLERILLRTLEISECRGKVIRNGTDTRLYAEHESDKALEELSRKLSENVPHSIFMKSFRVEAADHIPENSPWKRKETRPESMPPCPKCLSEISDPEHPNYGNIFTGCEICGYPVFPSDLTLTKASRKRTVPAEANHRNLFDVPAKVIRDGGVVSVNTMNGPVALFLPDGKNAKRFGVDGIVACDVHAAATFFEMQKGEILALGSIEKPKIRLLASEEFHAKFPEYPSAFSWVRLPDDMVLFLLMDRLSSLGEPLVCLSESIVENPDASLTFSSALHRDIPEAVVTEEGETILISGERAILPWTGKGFGKKSLSLCGNFAGIMDGTAATVTFRENMPKRLTEKEEILICSKERSPLPSADAPVITFENRHAAFFSVLGEHGLIKKTTAAIYLGREDDCAVMIHSEKFGLVDFLTFDFGYTAFDDLFEDIRTMNETGGKLLENFQKKQKENFERWLGEGIEHTGSNVTTLFGVIGMILGFGDSTASAAGRLLENAAEFKGKKGPRIDYRLREERRLDPLWSIRTAMSFKLAGLDDQTLSFGIVESFSEFLSKTIDEIQTDLGLDGVILCGSMFGEKKILQKTHLLIAKNHPVYFNLSLPTGGSGTVYGALLLTL